MPEAELDLDYFRQKLQALQDKLEALQSTVDEAAETVELDQARVGRLSRMDALQAQSMSMKEVRVDMSWLLILQPLSAPLTLKIHFPLPRVLWPMPMVGKPNSCWTIGTCIKENPE